MPHVWLNSKFCRPDKSAYYRQTICLTERLNCSIYDKCKGLPGWIWEAGVRRLNQRSMCQRVLLCHRNEVILDLLDVIEADPAVTLAGKGLQQSPLGCTLTCCLRNNGEHTLASKTTGAIVRAGAFADAQVRDRHPDRVG